MAKLYSKNSIKSIENYQPKEETVNFLLSYSKALRVINCNYLKVEMLQN